MMYLKLKVLSQDSRLPLHLPHKSCLWGRLGSTWRCVTAHEQRALLHVWKKKGLSLVGTQWDILILKVERKRAYMTCDVLNTVWVELLLAFPTVLFEVNLEHTMLSLDLDFNDILTTDIYNYTQGPHLKNRYEYTFVSYMKNNQGSVCGPGFR